MGFCGDSVQKEQINEQTIHTNTGFDQADEEVLDWIKRHRVDSTAKAYDGFGKAYMAFAEMSNHDATEQATLCNFMKREMERGLSRSTVVNVIPSAVGYLFRYGVKSPTRGIHDNILL